MTPEAVRDRGRLVVELVRSHGRSYSEVARVTGMSEDAVRDMARRSLESAAPSGQACPDPELRGALADYVLGQSTPVEEQSAREALARSADARQWVDSLRAPAPEVEARQPSRRRRLATRMRAARVHWPLWAMLTVALGALVATAVFVSDRGQILGFDDSPRHVIISLRTLTEGIRQLGTHWTPLFHVVELPFVWINPLYRTGLSGTVVSVLASLVTLFCVYRLALLLDGRRWIATTAALLLVASPNFLLAGVIPMQPSVIMASTTAAVYLFTRWATQGRHTRQLVVAGFALSVATLSHFDAWPLLPLEIGAAALVIYMHRRDRTHATATGLVLLVCGGYGVAVFIALNVLVFGLPTAFLHENDIKLGGSSPGGTGFTPPRGGDGVAAYPLASWHVAGPVLAVAGLIGVLVFTWRSRRSPATLTALILFYPLVWYTAQALTKGSYIVAGHRLQDWTHLRYAIPILPALAVFAAVGSRWRVVATALVVGVAAVSTVTVLHGQVAGWVDMTGESGKIDSVGMRPAAAWLRANIGEGRGRAWIPNFDPDNDRFELLTGVPPDQFVDTNATETWRLLNREPWLVDKLGVHWIIRVGQLKQPNFPLAILGTGARRCWYSHPNARASVQIYTIDYSCPPVPPQYR